jgi:hypothetical protein
MGPCIVHVIPLIAMANRVILKADLQTDILLCAWRRQNVHPTELEIVYYTYTCKKDWQLALQIPVITG